MDTFFLLCAIVGGTVLLIQFGLTLLGMGGDHGHGGGDSAFDVGGHDFTGDMHGGGHHDAGHHDAGHDAGHDSGAGDHGHDQHSTVWFFKVITFQTLVAAVAFFGIAGKAASEAGISTTASLVIALGVGVAAMYCVYYLIRGLHKFNADGTLQISRAIGQPATVYIPIPSGNSGAGKVQMNLQNRIIEFQAMTHQDRLPTGAKVKVVGVIGPDTVEVERLIEAETPSHA